MKILVITPKYYPDNFSIIPIVEHFVKRGNDVTVLTALPYDEKGKFIEGYSSIEKKDRLTIHRVKVKTRKKSSYSLMANYLSFHSLSTKWVKKCNEEFDLVYTFAISPVTALAAGNLYKEKHHVKHFAHILDVWPDALITASYARTSSPLYKIMDKWSKRLYEGVDQFILGSPSFKEYLVNHHHLDEKKMTYISQPALIGKEKEDMNPYLKDATNILYCGNISTTQLVDYIVPAMEKLNDRDVHFTIIGNGRYSSKLKEEISHSSMKDNIHYLGGMSYKDVTNYYKHVDAVFIGLKNQGFASKTIPNKLISSLSYGVPILSMLEGDGKQILEKTEGALFLDSNPESLALGIDTLKNMDKKEKEKMSSMNRKYYEDNFNIERIIDLLIVMFSSK